MATESVPLPLSLRAALLEKVPEGALTSWAIEAMAVEAAREGILSRHRAATLVELETHDAREAFFERHQLTGEYTREALDMDRQALDRLAEMR